MNASFNGHIKIYLNSLSAYFHSHISAALKQKVFFAGKLRFEPLEMLASKEQLEQSMDRKLAQLDAFLYHTHTHTHTQTEYKLHNTRDAAGNKLLIASAANTSKEFQLQFGLPQWSSMRCVCACVCVERGC